MLSSDQLSNVKLVIAIEIVACYYAELHYDKCNYVECHYVECHYVECHYVECPGALKFWGVMPLTPFSSLNF